MVNTWTDSFSLVRILSQPSEQKTSDVVLESNSVLELDSSLYFSGLRLGRLESFCKDSGSDAKDSDSNPEDSDSSPRNFDSDSAQ